MGYVDHEVMNGWRWMGSGDLVRKRPLRLPDVESLGTLLDRMQEESAGRFPQVTINNEVVSAQSFADVVAKIPRNATMLGVSGDSAWVEFSSERGGKTLIRTFGGGYGGIVGLVALIENNGRPFGFLFRKFRWFPAIREQSVVTGRTRDAAAASEDARRVAWIGGLSGLFGGVLGGVATGLLDGLLTK